MKKLQKGKLLWEKIKELLNSYEYKNAGYNNIMEPHPKAKALAANINAAIYPLLFTFALIVLAQIIIVLQC